MSIAIQAADLDANRIDGTRVYLLRLLERFGTMFPNESWHLFHRSNFNPYLTPPTFPNYHIHTIPFPLSWTQTRFAWELFRRYPERLFMPVQALPVFLPKDTQSIVTIHDLAFKLFPEHFPSRDVQKLNWLTDYAIRHATRLIAVSNSTKRDILHWYPNISESKIRVIYHGFDIPQEGSVSQDEKMAALEKFHLTDGEYILYVGALQPRKNLLRLMEAFSVLGKSHPSAKLVLAGEAAWMSTEIFEARDRHVFRDRIVMTDRISFEERSVLYKYARIFVYPSLYEGFGLPILEAFASDVPVVCANNSSLPEVAGDAAQFFDANRSDVLADILSKLWNDSSQRAALITAGRKQIKKFSWDKCAKETAEWILE